MTAPKVLSPCLFCGEPFSAHSESDPRQPSCGYPMFVWIAARPRPEEADPA